MAKIAIYSYNNYYSRVRKRSNTLADYGTPLYMETGIVNFNPSDGVDTQYIAGRQTNSYDGSGDYLIYSSNGINISSRWFIIDSDRTRNNQYQLTLRRDLVADYYETVLNSQSLIKRAIVNDDNPLIWNQEGITFNEIKKDELLLKDYTGCPWIVGYLDSKYSSQTSISVTADISVDETYDNWSDWQYYNYLNTYVKRQINNPTMLFYCKSSSPIENRKNKFYFDTQWNLNYYSVTSENLPYVDSDKAIDELRKMDSALFTDNYRTYITDLAKTSYIIYDKLLAYNNKILKVNGVNYRMKVTVTNRTDTYAMTATTALTTFVTNALNKAYVTSTPNYILQTTSPTITLSYEEIDADTFTGTIGDRLHLKDAPYDMFCIPYANIKVINGSTQVQFTEQSALTFAQQLAVALGTNLYDLQIVPYCPATLKMTNNNINVDSSDPKRTTVFKDTSNTAKAMLIWATNSSGSFNINCEIPIVNKKIDNQCNKVRLVSPNYAGDFEFIPARNNGVTTVKVDYTYKPYSPYIHVAPLFGGLYGGNFNDARGLICGGDFSVCYLSNAWQQYQIQNKNYQDIFNREIQNMDTNRKYQRIEQSVSAATGALTTGVGAGLLAGPVAGVAAGVLSAAGGAADLAISEKLYKESKSFKTDIFNMQLDNIRALPNSIAKTSGFTANNKYFPFIEFYSCTDEEKTIFANYIRNYSMTVNSYGIISDYLTNQWSYNGITDRKYIEATIILPTDYTGDAHELSQLNQELEGGIYFS